MKGISLSLASFCIEEILAASKSITLHFRILISPAVNTRLGILTLSRDGYNCIASAAVIIICLPEFTLSGSFPLGEPAELFD